MRIAVIGGSDFDQKALDSFLWKLREKYPDATIVTGSGQGAERHVRDSASVLGFTVEIPALHEDWYGSKALECQITDVLIGADIILLVGQISASRPKTAMDFIHRMNMHARNNRGGLIKNQGHYVSHRSPGMGLVWHHIAPPAKQLSDAA